MNLFIFGETHHFHKHHPHDQFGTRDWAMSGNEVVTTGGPLGSHSSLEATPWLPAS
jgi:hypothetical protein